MAILPMRAALDTALADMAAAARRHSARSATDGARLLLADPARLHVHAARAMPILAGLAEDAQIARLRRAIADHRAAVAACLWWADRNHLVALRQVYVALRYLRLCERAGLAALAEAAE